MTKNLAADLGWPGTGTVHIGVDEVGRGCLAGPVTVGAVLLRPEAGTVWQPIRLGDSKKLTPKQRAAVVAQLIELRNQGLVVYTTASLDAPEIDRLGIRQATLTAMTAAVLPLLKIWKGVAPEIWIDGVDVPPSLVQRTSNLCHALVRGDDKMAAVALAANLAKETRDTYMRTVAAVKYPDYGFERHVGYGTAQHLEALQRVGSCPLHRHSFSPVAESRNWKDAPL